MDGTLFKELTQRQGCVATQREELEKQRKLLGRRKLASPSPSNGMYVYVC